MKKHYGGSITVRIATALLCFMIVLATISQTVVLAEQTWSIKSITWQDPNNAVLIWEGSDNCSYRIYRADSADGEYKFIGESKVCSFRDDSAKHPNTYYYKVECISNETNEKLSESGIMASGTNPQSISSVSVIMYHNFITEEDIASGVEFEEYSLKPEDFEADLIWLRENGYTTITSNDVIEYIKGNRVLPKKAVVLSIDDGTWGVYTNAWKLLKKYNMKADFNVIGKKIDDTWDLLHGGGTRDGQSAPYCTWEELVEMIQSGEINICSHTYGMHYYNRQARIGARRMDNETYEDYVEAIKYDYKLANRCIEGWTHVTPRTMAYPYSRRNTESDTVLLENTGYELLMAGDGARGTSVNHFVDGCSYESHLKLMSRPCRLEGKPIGEYLGNAIENDNANGVNMLGDYFSMTKQDCIDIAGDYTVFTDVGKSDWFAPSVYYAYVNKLMRGTASDKFSPQSHITRAMAATLLHRLAGNPAIENEVTDVQYDSWYKNAALWAIENNIMAENMDSSYVFTEVITREEMAYALYKTQTYMKVDCSQRDMLTSFTDASEISTDCVEAFQWAVSAGIYQGNGDGTLNPKGILTRAQMTAILLNLLGGENK